MKIIFYRYGSICEPDILDAFNNLGYTVYEITDEITNKRITPQQTAQLIQTELNKHPADLYLV